MDNVVISRAGDSSYIVSEIVSIKDFIETVEAILRNGGEMPVAFITESTWKEESNG